jgi:hypothetical protein
MVGTTSRKTRSKRRERWKDDGQDTWGTVWEVYSAATQSLHFPEDGSCRHLRIRQLSYEDVKKRAEPYTKIIEELPDMRRESVNLVKKAIAENRQPT